MTQRTYVMKFSCKNCQHKFTAEMRRGEIIEKHSVKCPYCGIEKNEGSVWKGFWVLGPKIEGE